MRLPVPVRSAAHWLRTNTAAIAWVVMAVGVSVLFWDEARDDAKDRRDGVIALEAAQDAQQAVRQAQTAQERAEQEGLERDYRLCANSNEARAGLVALVHDFLLQNDGVVSESEQVYLDLTAERFAQKECPPDPSPGD